METLFDADCNFSHSVLPPCCYCDVMLYVLVKCCLYTLRNRSQIYIVLQKYGSNSVLKYTHF